MAKVPIVIGQEKKAPLQNYQIIIEGIWGDGRVHVLMHCANISHSGL